MNPSELLWIDDCGGGFSVPAPSPPLHSVNRVRQRRYTLPQPKFSVNQCLPWFKVPQLRALAHNHIHSDSWCKITHT